MKGQEVSKKSEKKWEFPLDWHREGLGVTESDRVVREQINLALLQCFASCHYLS